jgi:hypothetical protein
MRAPAVQSAAWDPAKVDKTTFIGEIRAHVFCASSIPSRDTVTSLPSRSFHQSSDRCFFYFKNIFGNIYFFNFFYLKLIFFQYFYIFFI